MTYLFDACRIEQTILEQCLALLQSWAGGLTTSPGNVTIGAQHHFGHQQQQTDDSTALELQHIVSSLGWALSACLLTVSDAFVDVPWLAVQICKQLLCWEEVLEQLVVVEDPVLLVDYVCMMDGASKGCALMFPAHSDKQAFLACMGVAMADKVLSVFDFTRLLSSGLLSVAAGEGSECKLEGGALDRVKRVVGTCMDKLWEGEVGSFTRTLVGMVDALRSAVQEGGIPGALQEDAVEAISSWGSSTRDEVLWWQGMPCGVAVAVLRGLVVNVFATCSARGCCDNPRCRNLAGVSEMGLVVGREGARGLCSGCREVCYCSRKRQEEACVLHKQYCTIYMKRRC